MKHLRNVISQSSGTSTTSGITHFQNLCAEFERIFGENLDDIYTLVNFIIRDNGMGSGEIVNKTLFINFNSHYKSTNSTTRFGFFKLIKMTNRTRIENVKILFNDELVRQFDYNLHFQTDDLYNVHFYKLDPRDCHIWKSTLVNPDTNRFYLKNHPHVNSINFELTWGGVYMGYVTKHDTRSSVFISKDLYTTIHKKFEAIVELKYKTNEKAGLVNDKVNSNSPGIVLSSSDLYHKLSNGAKFYLPEDVHLYLDSYELPESEVTDEGVAARGSVVYEPQPEARTDKVNNLDGTSVFTVLEYPASKDSEYTNLTLLQVVLSRVGIYNEDELGVLYEGGRYDYRVLRLPCKASAHQGIVPERTSNLIHSLRREYHAYVNMENLTQKRNRVYKVTLLFTLAEFTDPNTNVAMKRISCKATNAACKSFPIEVTDFRTITWDDSSWEDATVGVSSVTLGKVRLNSGHYTKLQNTGHGATYAIEGGNPYTVHQRRVKCTDYSKINSVRKTAVEQMKSKLDAANDTGVAPLLGHAELINESFQLITWSYNGQVNTTGNVLELGNPTTGEVYKIPVIIESEPIDNTDPVLMGTSCHQ